MMYNVYKVWLHTLYMHNHMIYIYISYVYIYIYAYDVLFTVTPLYRYEKQNANTIGPGEALVWRPRRDSRPGRRAQRVAEEMEDIERKSSFLIHKTWQNMINCLKMGQFP